MLRPALPLLVAVAACSGRAAAPAPTPVHHDSTAPTADTYVTTKVLLLTDKDETGKSKAYCWLNGKLVAKHEAAAGAINGQASVYPYLYLQGVTTIARIATIDYVRVAWDRFPLETPLE